MTTRRFARAIALTLGVLAATRPTAAFAFYVSVDIPHHPKTWGVDVTSATWTGGIACVSFVNHMDRPLTHVVIAITVAIDSGPPETSYLHRRGSFAPNVPIESGGSLLRGRANCMRVAEPPPNASPTASVHVTVEAQDAE